MTLSQSFLVYQPKSEPIRQDDIDMYVSLRSLPAGNGVDVVQKALAKDFYEPTFFLHMGVMTAQTSPDMDDVLEWIFDECNGYGSGKLRRTTIRPSPSMSVGDIVMCLQSRRAFVVLSFGWQELDIELKLICNGVVSDCPSLKQSA